MLQLQELGERLAGLSQELAQLRRSQEEMARQQQVRMTPPQAA